MRQIYFYGVLLSLWIITVSGIAEPNNAHQQPNQLNNRPVAPDSKTQWCWHRDLMRIHFNLIKPGGENDLKKDILKNGTKKYKHKKDYEPADAPSKLTVYESEDPKDCGLVFAFKGTDTNKRIDVLHDLDFISEKGELNHAGFKQAAEKYAGKVLEVLEEIKKLPQECKAPKLTFTGHSLGGAIAYNMVNLVLRKELESFRPKPELVLFGTPRVTRGITQAEALLNISGQQMSPPIALNKGIHYYIENDPVTVVAPNSLFQDLTDNNFKFEPIPINEQASDTGSLLIQNHLPGNYLKRMDEACKGPITPDRTSEIKYSTDIVNRLLRAAQDKRAELATKVVKVVGNVAQNVVNTAGAVIDKGKEGLETARVGIPAALAPRDLPGDSSLWIKIDGASFARTAACNVFSALNSKEYNGRRRYCNEDRTGFNTKAQEKCSEMCRGNSLCVDGCYDEFTIFCIDTGPCPWTKPSGK